MDNTFTKSVCTRPNLMAKMLTSECVEYSENRVSLFAQHITHLHATTPSSPIHSSYAIAGKQQPNHVRCVVVCCFHQIQSTTQCGRNFHPLAGAKNKKREARSVQKCVDSILRRARIQHACGWAAMCGWVLFRSATTTTLRRSHVINLGNNAHNNSTNKKPDACLINNIISDW